jgi:CHAT domain-containing protein
LPNCGVLHFAGHSVTDDDAVRTSALLLAPSGDDHGEFLLKDIAALRIPNVRLVVLAACGTAARITRGDGAENIALAFMAAGVPTVVASLWDLADGTSSETMTSLHRELGAGVSAARAVQALIVARLRRDDRTRLVRQWSNIVTVGGASEFLRAARGVELRHSR